MSLKIEQRETEGIVILDLDGDLILGDPNAELRDKLRTLCATGHNRIALNLAGVGRIDSTGLGTLVFAFTATKKALGGLALFHLDPNHLDLLLLTKLTTVFELFTSERDAVNHFFPGRGDESFDVLEFVREQEKDRRPHPEASSSPAG